MSRPRIYLRALLLALLSLLMVQCTDAPATQVPERRTALPLPPDLKLRGIAIGNALDAPTPGEWGVTIQPEYFRLIKGAGFNAVRLPVRFPAHMLPAPPYTLNEDFMQMLDRLVNDALEAGLTVVLDFHHFDEMMADPQGNKVPFLAIWEQLSVRYQSYPDTLLFELLNEPHGNFDAAFWNELLAETLPLIRATNPRRWVLAGGVDYNDVSQLALLRLPRDDHLIATFHYYEPFEFTHQGAHWVEGSESWIGTRWTGSDDQKRAVRDALDLAVVFSETHGVRVLMGEFGSGEDAKLDERAAWAAFVAREAEARGISWFYWQFCSDFGIYDCAAERFSHPLLDALFPK